MKTRPTLPAAKYVSKSKCEVFVVILRTGDDQYWLLAHACTEGGKKAFCLKGWRTLREGMAYFERAYHVNHRRGYEASMSACINYIQLQPKIVGFANIKELELKLLPVVPENPTEEQVKAAALATTSPFNARRTVHGLNTVSGNYDVLPLLAEVARPFWDAGASPNLI